MAKEKKGGGAPAWMATFADMSTLLLTFFVIMLSMSTLDVVKFKSLLGSVQAAFGVQFEEAGEFQAVIPEDLKPVKDPGEGEFVVTEEPKGEDVGGTPDIVEEMAGAKAAEKLEQEEAVKELKEAIKETQLGDQAEVHSGERGIRVRVKGALLFDPGRANLTDRAVPLLENMIQVLHKFGYYLLVEGHTDSVPISTAQFPSNWELSSFRAASVLRFLVDHGINTRRLTSVGVADNFPIASNETPEGRAENRRVEFILTKQPFRPDID